MRAMRWAVLSLLMLCAAASAQVEGVWRGTLDVGAAKLRLQLNLARAANGLQATLVSIDQGGVELKADSASLNDGKLTVVWKVANAQYTGRLSADGSTLQGEWAQLINKWPLALHRAEASDKAAEGPKRPQTPKPPYPYKSEDVVYEGAEGVRFAATLTLPEGSGPFAAIVLLPGSGAHDRDETIFGHKPFLLLADFLTRAGYAVLRFDQRGVGQSTGTMRDVTVMDEADDAEAALRYLATRPEIDRARLGLLGHSEGAEVAPVVAARREDVAFVVGLGAPAVRGEEMIVDQVRRIVLLGGGSAELSEKQAGIERELLDAVLAGKGRAQVAAMLSAASGGQLTSAVADAQAAQLLSKGYTQLIAFDPQPSLRALRCPMLAIYGGKDSQVSPELNAEPMREALRVNGVKGSEVFVLPGLNHLLQTAATGAVGEYSQIEETMAPEALQRIAQWLGSLKTH